MFQGTFQFTLVLFIINNVIKGVSFEVTFKSQFSIVAIFLRLVLNNFIHIALSQIVEYTLQVVIRDFT